MSFDPVVSAPTTGRCPSCHDGDLGQGLHGRMSRPALSLLGGWRLELEDSPLEVQRSVQRLLAFVALRRHCSRNVVAGQLWPESTEARAHGNLRSTLWRAHKIAPELITERSGALSIGRTVDLDVNRLVRRARCLIDDGGRAHEHADAERSEVLLEHDLLPGWYDDWLVLERERLRQLQLHALESLARSLAGRSRFSDAVDVAMGAIAAEPVRESAHRIVIEAHLAEGNFGEARRAYESLRRVLAIELGVEPSHDLTARVVARPP